MFEVYLQKHPSHYLPRMVCRRLLAVSVACEAFSDLMAHQSKQTSLVEQILPHQHRVLALDDIQIQQKWLLTFVPNICLGHSNRSNVLPSESFPQHYISVFCKGILLNFFFFNLCVDRQSTQLSLCPVTFLAVSHLLLNLPR